MLSELRKQSRSVLIYVLFAIIIVVFVFTFNVAGPEAGCGGGGGSSSKDTTLARIGDHEIDPSTLHMGLALTLDPPLPGADMDPRSFQAAFYYRATRFFRLRGDPLFQQFIPDPRSVSGIKAQKVMDDLTETLLVAEEAEARGLRASPDEVRTRIVSSFTDGSSNLFNKRQYDNWVRYGLHTSLGQFEDFVRQEILREKMIGLLTANVTVSDREVRHVAQMRKTKRNAEYLELSPDLLAGWLAADPIRANSDPAAYLKDHLDEVQKYFDGHKGDYRVEAKFDTHLAVFPKPAAPTGDAVTDEQKAAYEAAIKAVRDEVAAKRDQLVTQQGPARLAAFKALGNQTFSVKPQWTLAEAGTMAPELRNALQKMAAGDLSDPVETEGAFYLVAVAAMTPAVEPVFDDVKNQVAARLMAREKAKTMLDAEAAKLLALAQADPTKSLTATAEQFNAAFAPHTPVKAGETGDVPFMPESLASLEGATRNAVPGLGESEELFEALWGLTLAQPLAPKAFSVTGSESRFIVRLKAETPASEPTPEELEAVRNELLPLKKQAFYREWYGQVKATAQTKGRVTELPAFKALVQDEANRQQEAAAAQAKARQKAGGAMPIQIPIQPE